MPKYSHFSLRSNNKANTTILQHTMLKQLPHVSLKFYLANFNTKSVGVTGSAYMWIRLTRYVIVGFNILLDTL